MENLKTALTVQVCAMVVMYILFALGASFIAWDFKLLWVGNWDNFGRVLYYMLSVILGLRIIYEYTEG